MTSLKTFAVAALLVGSAALGTTVPANAGVSVSVGIGGPVFSGDYDYYRPCSWYRYNNLPAPERCYGAYIGFYGSNVFVVDGFVFRDRNDWGRWHDRDDWQHWRAHQFRRADWQRDNGRHNGWFGQDSGRHDQGQNHDERDNGRDHDRGHDWRDNGDHNY